MFNQFSKHSVTISSDLRDIIAVNRRSADTQSEIRIIELSTLSDLIPLKTAEIIRRKFLKNNVQVRQLTNERVFASWTKVNDFVKQCLHVRYVPNDILPINIEMLLFDDVVAMYRIEPDVSVIIVEDAAFAAQQKALFDNFWHIAKRVSLRADGSTTYAVTINRKPEDVYGYVANLGNWPEFSDFAANFEQITDDTYIAHTSQGDITVAAQFDPAKMLLDTVCTLPDGTSDFIPYRVVPNKRGSELLMTNFQPQSATRAEYDEQLAWMDIELQRIKAILEKDAPT